MNINFRNQKQNYSTRQSYLPVLIIILIVTLTSQVVFIYSNWQSLRYFKEVINPKTNLAEVVGRIAQLDETLTMSAQMLAATGDPRWEQRYLIFEPQLNTAIQEVKQIAPDFFIGDAADQTDKANVALVRMEKEAFELVRQNKISEAQTLLNSEKYNKQKQLYTEGFQQMKEAWNKRNSEQFDSENNKFVLSLIYTIVMLVLLLFAWIAIIRLIRKHDIKRTRTEEELKERNKQLHAAIKRAEESEKKLKHSHELAKLGSWELDYETEIFTFNDNLYKIFQTTAEEMGGYQVPLKEYAEKFVHPDDASLVAVESEKAVTTNDPNFSNYVEHRIKYFNGGVGYIGVRYFILKDKNGKTIKSFGINQDITEKKNVELELIKAKEKAEKSDKIKSAFLASMSHEIRTPLNAIIGFSNIIANSVNDPKLMEFSSLINNQNDLLLNLVNDILDFAKIESGVLEFVNKSFDLNNLIDEIFLMYSTKSSSDTKLITQKLSDSVMINSDHQRIKQVFSNLISNALKFTKKGEITLGYELNDKSEVVCFVKDTGIGISKDKQESVFERFTKLDTFSQSTGLGLAISKNLVELLGGKIWLESEPNKGSEFYFTIPVEIEETEPAIVELEKKETKLTDDDKLMTVLVVEDDMVNFLYVKELLKSSNRNILHVENGLEAVELVETNDNIDLILMDIKLPVMNGYEATRKIKKIKPHLPVIALTAYALPEDEKKAKNAGCDDYISKPINKEKLFALILSHFKNN